MSVSAQNAGANTLATLNGFYKEIYSDNLKDLVPEGVKLGKMIPFVKPNKRMGFQYHQPVTLQLEHGVTYGGTTGVAFDLLPAIAGKTQDATVQGCEMVLRGRISYGAVSRSINDSASFGRATKHVIKNLMISSYKKQEQMLFYGQKGLGFVAADVTAVDTFVITDASFAAGIFAGGEGMKLTIKQGVTGTDREAEVQIKKVDIKNKSIQLTAAVTLLAGDVIYEFGAYGNECLGLEAMLDGTVAAPFGILSSEYSLWEGNKHSIGGASPLSFKEISLSIADAVSKGLEGKLDAFVNPNSWADLLNEQTSVRQFDSSYSSKKYENGSESIMFHSQNGIIEIHSSTYVKEGLAFVLDLKSFSRVGSQELSFKIPGTSEDFVIKLENANGVEFRTYCDTALFCDAIGHNILIEGILNGAV